MWLKAMVVIFLCVGMTGCGSTTFSSEDVRLHTAGDTLYLLARSDRGSRSLCGSLGGDVTRAEAGWAAEGRTMQLGWVTPAAMPCAISSCARTTMPRASPTKGGTGPKARFTSKPARTSTQQKVSPGPDAV
jgi:hypothetical protein